MTEPELPKPIYPQTPTGPGNGGGGGGWGAPAGPPGPPGGPGGPPPGPPPGGPGFGGYGTGGPGPGGPGGPGGSGDKKPTAAIMAVVAVVIAAIVGIAIATSGDDDSSASDTTTTSAPGGGTGTTTTGGGTTESSTTGSTPDLEAIAQQQVLVAGPSTVDCIASGLEGSPDLIEKLEGVAAPTFDDPDQAQRYATLIVDCATTQELLTEFENGFTQTGVDPAATECIVFNMSSFGSTQWTDLISTSVQPSEASYLTQMLQQLAVC